MQLLLNKGSEMNIVKRMLDSVDEEGDTVSLLMLIVKEHCSYVCFLVLVRTVTIVFC